MLVGRQLWKTEITGDMETSKVNGRCVDVFPDAPRSLYDSLVNASAHHGPKIAIVDDNGQIWTYGKFLHEVRRFASYLSAECHIGHGDRVGILLETSVEFCIAAYAINRIGAVMVPIPTKYRRPEVEALIKRSRAQIVLTDEHYRDFLRGFLATGGKVVSARVTDEGNGFLYLSLPEIDNVKFSSNPEDDAILMYTSGTTSLSKGVILTNANVGHAIIAYKRVLGITDEDIGILPVPIYYVTGLVALLGLFIHSGARMYLHRRFDASRILADVQKHSITLIHASPTVFSLLLDEAPNFPKLPSLKQLACGAAHMPVSQIRALHEWLPNMSFRTVYGLTETTSPAFIMDSDAASSSRVASSGRPIPGMNARILRDNGDEAEVGERGEICLYGTNILRRYDETDAVGLSTDGWLRTGDVGYFDQDGYLYVVDRLKDMINRGGEKVWCVDVEEELRGVAGVSDAAVVGLPDAKYGEVPAAVVVLDPNVELTGEAIRQRLRARLASYQIPASISIVRSIPLTRNMKVDKRSIRGQLLNSSPRKNW